MNTRKLNKQNVPYPALIWARKLETDNSKCQLQSRMQSERTVPLTGIALLENIGSKENTAHVWITLQRYAKMTCKPLNYYSTSSALTISFGAGLMLNERGQSLILHSWVPHWVWLEVVSCLQRLQCSQDSAVLGHCTLGRSNPSTWVFKWI